MNTFEIPQPALISFSGGRTSGLMLWSILRAYDGTLPDDVHVTFANTGKERLETLDFVHECGQQWNVPIRWLEWTPQGMAEVDYESASRNGEPYEALIGKKGYLPNPVTRFCTMELKVRVMRDHMKAQGYKNWTNVVGLRADEGNRVYKMNERNRKGGDPWKSIAPLYDAGITEHDVMAFWKEQPFDLQLRPHEGNCDLCFLKGAAKISAIIREHPDITRWWERMESETLQPFRIDRPDYKQLREAVEMQAAFDFSLFDDMMSCDTLACTD